MNDGIFGIANGSGAMQYATASQAAQLSSQTAVMSPARMKDALSNWREVWPNLSVGASGGSINLSYPNVMTFLSTNTTASGTATAYVHNNNATGFHFQSLVNSPFALCDWSKPQTLCVRVLQYYAGTSTSIFRIQRGMKATVSAFARLNGSGMGFEVRSKRVWILAHDGVVLTETDTGIDFSTVCAEVLLESDGRGRVMLALKTPSALRTATSTGGPFSLSAGNTHLTAELTNGTDATNQAWYVSPFRVSII